jgi:hypothetical protein
VPVHDVPLTTGACAQVPSALQLSAVHALPSSHSEAEQHSPKVSSMLVS